MNSERGAGGAGLGGLIDAERYAFGDVDHAMLEIKLVVLEKDDPHRQPQQTIVVPLDEVESGLQPDQITSLRRLRSFGVMSREGGLQVAIHATVRQVIVKSGAEPAPPVEPSLRKAAVPMGRQQRRQQVREQRPTSEKVGLVLEVAVGAGDPTFEDAHLYSFELAELEAKLPPEHAAALRTLQPIAVSRESDEVWITLSLSRPRPDVPAGNECDDPACLRLIH